MREPPIAPYDSLASVCKFQGYEAGNRDGEVELPDDCLQIGQAASKWIDRNDVPVTRGGQRGEAEIQHGPDFLRAACWGDNINDQLGVGPYKFLSFTPGVELVLEAFDRYWRKTPSVKRLVFKSIPEETTRLAALQRGEVDIVYSIRGELAEELQRLQPTSTVSSAESANPRPR
jgi:ABC-type transport system substrate-binding protein